MTARWLGIAALLSSLALVGYLVPWGGELVVLADLAWLAMLVVDRARAPRRLAFQVTREAPAAFTAGRPTTVTYRWLTSGARAARLVVREDRPGVLGGLSAPEEFTVPTQGVLVRRRVDPRRHGRAEGGGLVVRALGPWGLAWRQWRVEVPWEATVFPARRASRLPSSAAWARRRREHGLHAARRRGEGRLFESLREWTPGDDVRLVDWKATARRGKLIARQYEEERRQHLLLVLDAGRLMTADLGGASRMDGAVHAAVELAYAAVERDDDVGVLVFADGVKQYLTPRRGRRGLRSVLTALATAEATLVEPDYPGAFRYLAAHNRRRALSVVFTDVIDRFASEALVAHVGSLRPRHLVLAVALRDPALDAVAHARAAAPEGAYRKAAAHALLAAREEGLAAMRATGALVLDVAPADAAQSVVRAYRELKRRGAL